MVGVRMMTSCRRWFVLLGLALLAGFGLPAASAQSMGGNSASVVSAELKLSTPTARPGDYVVAAVVLEVAD
ncbi:MAG: hypothetical protein R3336_10020, partial [Phycisphaeraceae bacterium]|nr:hypothetical protein [Phycisphaeraceae bacterium]